MRFFLLTFLCLLAGLAAEQNSEARLKTDLRQHLIAIGYPEAETVQILETGRPFGGRQIRFSIGTSWPNGWFGPNPEPELSIDIEDGIQKENTFYHVTWPGEQLPAPRTIDRGLNSRRAGNKELQAHLAAQLAIRSFEAHNNVGADAKTIGRDLAKAAQMVQKAVGSPVQFLNPYTTKTNREIIRLTAEEEIAEYYEDEKQHQLAEKHYLLLLDHIRIMEDRRAISYKEAEVWLKLAHLFTDVNSTKSITYWSNYFSSEHGEKKGTISQQQDFAILLLNRADLAKALHACENYLGIDPASRQAIDNFPQQALKPLGALYGHLVTKKIIIQLSKFSKDNDQESPLAVYRQRLQANVTNEEQEHIIVVLHLLEKLTPVINVGSMQKDGHLRMRLDFTEDEIKMLEDQGLLEALRDLTYISWAAQNEHLLKRRLGSFRKS